MNSVRGRLTLVLAAAAVLIAGCRRPLADTASYSESNVALLRTALGGDKAAATTSVAAAEPTGWATIKGVFKINGTPPSSAQLSITSDHAVCMPGGKPVFANDIVVDPESRARGFRYTTVQVYDGVKEHNGVLERGGREGRAPIRLGDVAFISFVRDPDGNLLSFGEGIGANATQWDYRDA